MGLLGAIKDRSLFEESFEDQRSRVTMIIISYIDAHVTCFVLQLFLYVLFIGEGVGASDAERRLVRDLFVDREYDSTVRPVEFDEHAVNVTLDFALFQLISIDEKAQTIEVSAWLREKWTDSQLTWDPAKYNGIKEFNTLPSKVWLPDIVLYNNVDDDMEFGGNLDRVHTRVMVDHTGSILWLMPVILKGNCAISVSDFPFDTQHCSLKFGSWTYNTLRLNLTLFANVVDTAQYIENNEWSLIKTEAVRSETKYTCCSNKYPDVTFHLYLARRSLFYVLNLVFPIAVITLLTTMAFMLPAESGERISLAITLMLAVTVFMLLVAETTPETSDAIPLVTVYFILCMVAMFVMIVLLCYVSRLYHRELTDGAMGDWTRRWILEKCSIILRVQSRVNRVLCSDEIDPQGNPLKDDRKVIENTHQKNGILLKSKTVNDENRLTVIGDGVINSKDLANLKQLSKASRFKPEDARKLDDIIKKLSSNEEELKFKADWRIVAMTIDRFLFLFFISFFLVVTVGCFSHTSFVA